MSAPCFRLSKVSELTTRVISSIHRYGYLCGVPNGIETPGLMTGLAGTGLQLLRLAKPSQVPSVLKLNRQLLSTRINKVKGANC